MLIKTATLFAIVPVIATFRALSVAGPNQVADAGSKGSKGKDGAEVFAENCSSCHETRPSFDAKKLEGLLQHIDKEAADLSPDEREAIIAFLRSG